MILYDLLQDIYLETRSTHNLYDEIRDAGFPEAVSIPLTIKRKIADLYRTIGKYEQARANYREPLRIIIT